MTDINVTVSQGSSIVPYVSNADPEEDLTTIVESLCACYASHVAYSQVGYLPADLNKEDVISNTATHSGTLVTRATGAYLDLVLPYIVLIGDSIAEGHPTLHGRLHTGATPAYDLNYASQAGQTSWELSRLLGVPVVNQGIGSQTSTQVLARWNRDVLGQAVAVGDGLPNTTLTLAGQLPFAVCLHVGINDLGSLSDVTIKANLTAMAESCEANNIYLVVDTIGPLYYQGGIFDSLPMRERAAGLNAWMVDTLAATYSTRVSVADFLMWGSAGTGDFRTLRAGMYADYTHPNTSGYAAWARVLAASIPFAAYLSSLRLISKHSVGVASFARCTLCSLNGAYYAMPAAVDDVRLSLGELASTDNPVVRLLMTEWAWAGDYSGYAGARGRLSLARPGNLIYPTSATRGRTVVAAGPIVGGAIETAYNTFGVATVNVSDVAANGHMTITFNQVVTQLDLQMVGTNGWMYYVEWGEGAMANGLATWDIYLRSSSTGALITDVSKYIFQFFGVA